MKLSRLRSSSQISSRHHRQETRAGRASQSPPDTWRVSTCVNQQLVMPKLLTVGSPVSQNPAFVLRGQSGLALLARFGFVIISSFNARHSLALALPLPCPCLSFLHLCLVVGASTVPTDGPTSHTDYNSLLNFHCCWLIPCLAILSSVAFPALAFLATVAAKINAVLVASWWRGGLLVSALLCTRSCCMPSLEGFSQCGCRAVLYELDLCSHLSWSRFVVHALQHSIANVISVHLRVQVHQTFRLSKIVDHELWTKELEILRLPNVSMFAPHLQADLPARRAISRPQNRCEDCSS